jgi:hypothetical protein
LRKSAFVAEARVARRLLRWLRAAALAAGAAIIVARSAPLTFAALYPRDARRLLTEADEARFAGAGVLMCYTDVGGLERAAAAWLIGAQDLVALNAHNFVDRRLAPTRSIGDCFFRIGGGDYYFDVDSLRLGGVDGLHVTDDWALAKLIHPVPDAIRAQPVPDTRDIATGAALEVEMASPAGHSNSRLAATVERCRIHMIDAPGEAHARRARHDCNDGYGGSGSGLFTLDGRLIALHSASLDMNLKRPFDIDAHYGSALMIEGDLLAAIRRAVESAK